MDARIGTLTRSAGTVYYAFAHGYDKPEVQGTLAKVEAALGLRIAVKPLRHFTVTVTPDLLTYGSHGVNGEYIADVTARTHAEALKKARAERRAEEGRMSVPCTYRARLAQS